MAKGKKVAVAKIPLKEIKLGRNSRLDIREEELSGLMQSIKEEGLLEPIGVVDTKTGYEVAYGNRRFLACSKLGFTHIPAVIHYTTKQSDIDMKNLTENIQRRNISLAEAGRYFEILEEVHGLTHAEMAVRLGVTPSYVNMCVESYRDVPKEFQKDLEVRVVKGAHREGKKGAGKISLTTARKIINLQKKGRINVAQSKELFKMAKQDGFRIDNVEPLAKALALGTDPKNIEKSIHVTISFNMNESDYDRLVRKHVEDGPFKTFPALCRAILTGKKSEHLKILND